VTPQRGDRTVREIVKLYIDAYRSGDTAKLDEIISPDFVDHTFPTFSGGPDGVRRAIETLHRSFGELAVVIEDFIYNDDTAALRVVTTAKHIGTFAGMPASLKQVTWSACDFLRVRDGKIAELWSVQDTISLLRGIGALGAAAT
jgi:steroid delta-isomerase-like uncharacterized protein